MPKSKSRKTKLKPGPRSSAVYGKNVAYYDSKDDDVSSPAERVRIKPTRPEAAKAGQAMVAMEAASFLDFLNSATRRRRREIYANKLRNNPGAKRIVSEGDSWHLYPEIIQELIDQLNRDPHLAIFSADGAGDTFTSIWAERLESNKGFVKSLANEKPGTFLFCGGGNDLLFSRKGPDGKKIGNLFFHLNDFRPGMTAQQLIKPSINSAYDTVESQARAIVAKALEFPSVKRIVYHGYDYPYPDGDVWLGKPMARRGIVSPSLQRQICIILIDRLHDRFAKIAQSFAGTGKVRYVDVRNVVTKKSEWHDELHPGSDGFKKIAALVKPHL
ncbi:MAG: hypothetical protein HC855_08370 [Rhizobiales bacterium]|nr:hypothetical protein [Hyphomicrobiales bacterium]